MTGEFYIDINDKLTPKSYDKGDVVFFADIGHKSKFLSMMRIRTNRPDYWIVYSDKEGFSKWPFDPSDMMMRNLIYSIFGVEEWPQN